jgi:hypothetical protein
MKFVAAAEHLRRQEFARLAAAHTPRLEVFCSMTRGGFRDDIAAMMERLDHAIITVSPLLVTVKEGRKFVTHCAEPADHMPVKMPAIRRLHDDVVAAGAAKGIYVTARSFTAEAKHYADHAPIDLVDGQLLIASMQRSRKGVLMPQTYKAMCGHCGDIVQHTLANKDPLPCINGHLVAPPISRAAFVPYRPPAPAPGQQPAAPALTHGFAMHPAGPHPGLSGVALAKPGGSCPVIKPRNMSAKAQKRRAIKAHNHKLRARAISRQQERSAQHDD